ncbi:hypothetical protein [Roseobacter sp. A03A-229]
MKTLHMLVLLATLVLAMPMQKVRAYDIDCAIILCMAGGFPPGAVCSAAYAEMIRRVTPWPSEPPFGICSYVGPSTELVSDNRPESLDISGSDFGWLRATKVLWWKSRAYAYREQGELWDWSLEVCDHTNGNCQFAARVSRSENPWPEMVGGVSVGAAGRRAVMIRFSDFAGRTRVTHWIRY